jgi:hypothetical protein
MFGNSRVNALLLLLLLSVWDVSLGCVSSVTPAPAGVGGMSASGGAPALGGQQNQAGSPTKCQQACANLRKLKCADGESPCESQCAFMTSDARFVLDVQCRIDAKTKEQAQACGIASCR